MLGREITGDIPKIIANRARLYEGDLVPYFRTIFFNATNLQNPYHNFRHMLHVTWLCHQACEYYRAELTRLQMHELLIAALFHDFDHPGQPHQGELDPDRINIEIAICGLQKHAKRSDRPSLPSIEALIRATHFPYKTSGDELDLSGKIIRDADLAQALNPVWVQQVVIGLARESSAQPLDVLKMQPSFFDRLRFNTSWARELFSCELVAAKVAEAEALLRLLEG
jgi:hypothetical protein